MPCRLSARASGAQAAGDGAPPSDYRAADARDGDGPHTATKTCDGHGAERGERA